MSSFWIRLIQLVLSLTILVVFHEFGHFTDWYCNYGSIGSYETGETYSQAMQYLAFNYADHFTDRARTQNLRATLADRHHVIHGGHVLEMRVGATCEMFVSVFDGEVSRQKDEGLGINLWTF